MRAVHLVLSYQCVQMCCSVSRVFQKVNDLPPTGEVDEPTLDVMRQPRCGVEDPFNKRQHRYRVLGECPRVCIRGCRAL